MNRAWETAAMRVLAPAGFVMGAGLAALPAATGDATPGAALAWVAGFLALATGAGSAVERYAVPAVRRGSARRIGFAALMRASAIASAALACACLGSAEFWAAGIVWATRPVVRETIRTVPAEIENNRLGLAPAVGSEAYGLIQGRKVAGKTSPFTGCGWGPVKATEPSEGRLRVEFLTRTRVGTGAVTLSREGCDKRFEARISFSAAVSLSLLRPDDVRVSVLDYYTIPVARNGSEPTRVTPETLSGK